MATRRRPLSQPQPEDFAVSVTVSPVGRGYYRICVAGQEWSDYEYVTKDAAEKHAAWLREKLASEVAWRMCRRWKGSK